MLSFKVKKVTPGATVPTKKDASDAGIDIYTNETYILAPGEVHAFSTGISVEFPERYVALLWDRSGLGVSGIHRLAGVIDSGYRGEWKVVLVNLTDQPYEIKAGDKIVQCVLQSFEPAVIEEVEELTKTVRAEAGFGSSGR